jgi:hypothetical protein
MQLSADELCAGLIAFLPEYSIPAGPGLFFGDFYILYRICYNASIMKTATEYLLEQAGFEAAGPDVWGKAVGDLTAFIEVTPNHAIAWIWHPQDEVCVGPKMTISGEPDAAATEALFQLQALLAEDYEIGGVPRAFPAAVEQSVAPTLPA